MKRAKRALSIIFALVLLCGMFTGTVSAEEDWGTKTIESIAVSDYNVPENTGGTWVDAEGNALDVYEDGAWYLYSIMNAEVQVRFTDGIYICTSVRDFVGGYGNVFTCVYNAKSEPSYENQWSCGNSYDCRIAFFQNGESIGTCDFTTTVLAAVESIEAEDRTLIYNHQTSFFEQNSHGTCINQWHDYRTEKVTINYMNGTSISGTPDEILEKTGFEVIMSPDAEWKNWGIGTHTATAEYQGLTCEYNIIIEDTPVAKVEASDYTVVEIKEPNRTGYYDHANKKYVEAEWTWYNCTPKGLTITYKDGTVVTGSVEEILEQTGWTVSVAYGKCDQCYEHNWTVGNSYPLRARFLGVVSEPYYVTVICNEEDHKWGEWKTTVPASTEADGEQERVCSVCKETETQALKMEIEVEYDENVFEAGTYIVVEKLDKEVKHYKHTEESLKDAAEKFVVYDINAMKDNVKVQPNGKVEVTFPVPEGFGKGKVSVFHITEDGKAEYLGGKLSKDGKYITATVEHFSLYAVVEVKDGWTENPNTNDDNIIALSVSVLVVSTAVMFTATRKKNKFNV